MDLERLTRYVESACALIASLRDENLRLRQEVERLRLRNEVVEKAGRASQAKVAELLEACDRIR